MQIVHRGLLAASTVPATATATRAFVAGIGDGQVEEEGSLYGERGLVWRNWTV